MRPCSMLHSPIPMSQIAVYCQSRLLIKHCWPPVTVIVLTMYATQRLAALAAGADAFMIKGDDFLNNW
jgi:hypothetical protein